LAVGQTLLDHLSNLDLFDQVIPGGILRHPVHQLVGLIVPYAFRRGILPYRSHVGTSMAKGLG
jgi:hypothetical protein